MSIDKVVLNGEEIEIKDSKARNTIGSGSLKTMSATLIGAINEIDSEIGNNANLETVSKVVVNAINEVNGKIGDVNIRIDGMNSGGFDGVFRKISILSTFRDLTLSANSKHETYVDFKGWIPTGYVILMPRVLSCSCCVTKLYLSDNSKVNLELYNPSVSEIVEPSIDIEAILVKDGAIV